MWHGVDLEPVLEALIALIAAALSALAAFIGISLRAWIAQKIRMNEIKRVEQIQALFNEAAQRSMAYSESITPGGTPNKVDDSATYVTNAVHYLTTFWPDLTRGMRDIDLRKTIVARLPSGEAADRADALTLTKAGGGMK